MGRIHYAIVAVSYAAGHSHILVVKRCPWLDGEWGDEAIKTKTEIVASINGGTPHSTARKSDDGYLVWGEDVHVFSLDGVDFIRSDRNETPEDNLGELPEF